MINATYDISVDTPKLHRRGTIELRSDKDAIVAVLNVGEELRGARFEGTADGKAFAFEGSGEFPSIGQIDYVAKGSVWGSTLDIAVESSAGKITIFGTQLDSSAGSIASSHDYMMKASRADFSDDSTMYSGLFADGG